MFEITLKKFIPYTRGEYETQKHTVHNLDELMNLMTKLNPEQGMYEDDEDVKIIAIKKIA